MSPPINTYDYSQRLDSSPIGFRDELTAGEWHNRVIL